MLPKNEHSEGKSCTHLLECSHDVLERIYSFLPWSSLKAFRLSSSKCRDIANRCIRELCLPVNWSAARRSAVSIDGFDKIAKLRFRLVGSIFSRKDSDARTFSAVVNESLVKLEYLTALDFSAITCSPEDLFSLQLLPNLCELTVGALQSTSGVVDPNSRMQAMRGSMHGGQHGGTAHMPDHVHGTLDYVDHLPSMVAHEAMLAVSGCTGLTKLGLLSWAPQGPSLQLLSALPCKQSWVWHMCTTSWLGPWATLMLVLLFEQRGTWQIPH